VGLTGAVARIAEIDIMSVLRVSIRDKNCPSATYLARAVPPSSTAQRAFAGLAFTKATALQSYSFLIL
jgi:hypothetical protein